MTFASIFWLVWLVYWRWSREWWWRGWGWWLSTASISSIALLWFIFIIVASWWSLTFLVDFGSFSFKSFIPFLIKDSHHFSHVNECFLEHSFFFFGIHLFMGLFFSWRHAYSFFCFFCFFWRWTRRWIMWQSCPPFLWLTLITSCFHQFSFSSLKLEPSKHVNTCKQLYKSFQTTKQEDKI